MEENKCFSDIMTIYLSQIDSAMKVAEIISKHGNEDEITEDNIIMGLIYRLMNRMTDQELNDSLNRAKQIISDLSLEEEEGEEEDIIDREKLEYRLIRKNSCNCDICGKARADLINYKNYEPIDKLTEMYKSAIDNACEDGKIIINL